MTTKKGSKLVLFNLQTVLEIKAKLTQHAIAVNGRANVIFALRDDMIEQVTISEYRVKGSKGKSYRVNETDCECMYWQLHAICKHVLAVRLIPLHGSLANREFTRQFNEVAKGTGSLKMVGKPLYVPFAEKTQEVRVITNEGKMENRAVGLELSRVDRIRRWLVIALGGTWA